MTDYASDHSPLRATPLLGDEEDQRRLAAPARGSRASTASFDDEGPTAPLVYAGFLCAATGGLLFGYVIGVTGNAILSQNKDGSGGLLCRADGVHFAASTCFELTQAQKSFLVSINIVAALCATLVCFRFAPVLGRRRELVLGAALFAVGATLSATAHHVAAIWLGQGLYGLGVGFAMHAAPIFIAEIAPARLRGTLVSAKEALIVTGVLLGFCSGAAFGETMDGWRYELGAPVLAAVPMLVGMWLLPPSPRWVVLRRLTAAGRGPGRMSFSGGFSLGDEMVDALRPYRKHASEGAVEDEVREIVASLSESSGEGQPAPAATMGDAFKERRALVIGCGLVLLQQVTGQPSVLYYATSVFRSAGFGDHAALQSVYVGLAKLAATFVAVFTVDRFGRKPLLYVGIGLMLAALVALGLAFEHTECAVKFANATAPAGGAPVPLDARTCWKACTPAVEGCTDHLALPGPWGGVAVGSLMAYVSGYQVGFGPIAWLVISEIFPLKTRGAAFSLAALTNFGSNIIVTLVFQDVILAVGSAAAFWGYAALCLLSLVFVCRVVPETKGLTLEEITAKLNGDECGGADKDPGTPVSADGPPTMSGGKYGSLVNKAAGSLTDAWVSVSVND